MIAEKIKVFLETITYGGWKELQVAVDKETLSVYLTYPTIELILNYRPDSVREKLASKSLKLFLGEGLAFGKFSGSIVNKEKFGAIAKVTLISLDDFIKLATWESCINQNVDVAKLLAVGFGDSIRSITLEQLGFNIDADQRNEWLSKRCSGIEKRNKWTDAISDWLDKTDASLNTRKWIYPNVSDQLNLAATGYKSKYWCQKFSCVSATLRDHWNYSHVNDLEMVEQLATKKLLRGGCTPTEAMDYAIDALGMEINDKPEAEFERNQRLVNLDAANRRRKEAG